MKTKIPKIPPLEGRILVFLRDKRPTYGLMISRGARVKRGSIYIILERMAVKGFLIRKEGERKPHASGAPRPLYGISALGLVMLKIYDVRQSAERQASEILRTFLAGKEG